LARRLARLPLLPGNCSTVEFVGALPGLGDAPTICLGWFQRCFPLFGFSWCLGLGRLDLARSLCGGLWLA
jgi:hypothetical protein